MTHESPPDAQPETDYNGEIARHNQDYERYKAMFCETLGIDALVVEEANFRTLRAAYTQLGLIIDERRQADYFRREQQRANGEVE